MVTEALREKQLKSQQVMDIDDRPKPDKNARTGLDEAQSEILKPQHGSGVQKAKQQKKPLRRNQVGPAAPYPLSTASPVTLDNRHRNLCMDVCLIYLALAAASFTLFCDVTHSTDKPKKRLRVEKGIERAEAVMDQMEKKVGQSEQKGKSIKGRRVCRQFEAQSCIHTDTH